MRIGELATRAQVSVRALRYYEEQGLLTSERSPSGQRHYPLGAVDRVRLIQQLYAAGLSSRAIVELLPCVVEGRATPELLARLAVERDRIDGRVAELTGARDRLDSVINGATTNLRTGRSCGEGTAAKDAAPPDAR
ncbi:MerR family transcriptional regulator [Streptomyces sp. NPDC049954]|uniref:MerR family transcriptional regulator n=1 Tax=Streptomyces sp. NPDC049954 TaxID=3155779 RepID=UPI003448C283